MPTAWVHVTNSVHHMFIRALLDSGSHQSIITLDCARRLHLPLHRHDTSLITLGGSASATSNYRTQFFLVHAGDPPFLKVNATVLTQISLPTPNIAADASWPHIRSLNRLADVSFHLSRPINVLLGCDVLPHLFRPGLIAPTLHGPGAFNTSLGWVVCGPYQRQPHHPKRVTFSPDIPPQRNRVISEQPDMQEDTTAVDRLCESSSSDHQAICPPTPTVNISVDPNIAPSSDSAANPVLPLVPASDLSEDTHLNDIVRQFWELERVPDSLPLTTDERTCENIFVSDFYRLDSGRYVVPLPFASHRLGLSHNVATRRFLQLENRLSRQPELQAAYHEFMRDYLASGHMEMVPASEPNPPVSYYIPHHAVHRPDDPPTKLRVVFDASCASSNGKSLNDLLLTGPKLQADIATLLLRFRCHRIVFTADIRQMYRQILVRPEHRDHQRIVWRFSQEDPLQSYRLKTVTYGVSSAPYLALRTLQQLAIDEGDTHPQAKTVLLRDIYVDDILTGADSPPDAMHLRRQVQHLLKAGGFELRKWATNCPDLLHDIPEDHCRLSTSDDPLQLDRDSVVKILGLGWNPTSDCFFYAVRLSDAAYTKRAVLRQLARIFDPLGWLTPVTFTAKLFFQQLCRLKLDWDQDLPYECITIWHDFLHHLPAVSQLQLPRHLRITEFVTHELVGFCDASESGYAAVVYLRSSDQNNTKHQVQLLVAKSKVAPNKPVSLPRLELCGAHLLSKLLHTIKSRMLTDLPLRTITCFTDSTIALAWIRGESYRWKTFVGNRVAEIQELTSIDSWNHVASADNPADCASRGVAPHHLEHHPLWWRGPAWLSQSIEHWPQQTHLPDSAAVAVEEKASTSLVLLNTASECLDIDSIIQRFSSLLRLKRVIAYCLRFCANCKNPSTPRRGFLSSSELQTATKAIIRSIQRTHLCAEVKEAQDPQSRHRLVRQLNLFVDDDHLLRVGGRLSAAPLPYGYRHPILLPKNHALTQLIIHDAHIALFHAGALATHAYLRRQYWILDGRNVVRHLIGKCNKCFTTKPRPIIQPIGDLPVSRVSQASAFTITGIDYAGPFFISSARLRGATITKGYLVAFVCFTTKAVHFELASDLTTAAFIAAFRRFTARRGLPTTVFSDNGTNFVGAHHKLRDLGRFLSNPQHQERICAIAAARGIEWRFIPPGSPHFGGLWEAAVKSAKSHLTRVIGEQRLTYEEFLTVLTDIEAVLNSRPLCAVSSDASDPEPLTPGHFLIFRPLTAPPERDLTPLNLGRLSRWQLTERIHQDFWKRWSNEYLHTLQQRAKWLQPSTTISLGTVVIIKDDTRPPRQWPLGRIVALHPGRDNICRVADVHTSSGLLRRSLAKLCPLPTQ